MPAGATLRGRMLAVLAVVVLLNLLAGGGALWLGDFGAAGLGAG